jgi:hypothetical protein
VISDKKLSEIQPLSLTDGGSSREDGHLSRENVDPSLTDDGLSAENGH